MTMKRRDVFVRNGRSSVLLERFLIASVTTVLVIRLYLALTGYPQLGGGGLHISHMLWGGLGMLVALVLSLAFLGSRVQSLAALLGGIGFGAFIDELGKFLTSDNNYFFQPTLALIYIIFIILLLSFQVLEHPVDVSEQERPPDAPHMLNEKTLHDLDEQGKKERLFRRAVASPQFAPALVIFFAGYALLSTAFGSVNLLVGGAAPAAMKVGWLASSFLSYVLILIGIVFLRRSLLAAFTWFKRAMLASIFLTQVFLLSTQPMAALVALLVNLLVLAALNYLIRSH
jgi:hypothetical protein